jgi:hypothetical protein
LIPISSTWPRTSQLMQPSGGGVGVLMSMVSPAHGP